MRLAYVHFSKSIRWRLAADGPKLIDFAPDQDWQLVNPLLYGLPPLTDTSRTHFFCYKQGMLWASVNVLIVARVDEAVSRHEDGAVEALTNDLGVLLTKLRHISSHADIPKGEDFAMLKFDSVALLPDFPDEQAAHTASMIQTYPLSASVTLGDIESAKNLPSDYAPAIYETLLLDAIAAYQTKDHRVSVLFSAMAMEIAFGTKLDQEHQAILQGETDPRFRVLRIPIGNSQHSIKDPIYDRLKARIDFSVRMHEMSLYILGKSLRIDNDDLYKRALTLYRSRNKIVHLGTTEDTVEEVLPMDRDGAMLAIETSNDCFSWLGLSLGIKLPKTTFLRGEEFTTFVQTLDG